MLSPPSLYTQRLHGHLLLTGKYDDLTFVSQFISGIAVIGRDRWSSLTVQPDPAYVPQLNPIMIQN